MPAAMSAMHVSLPMYNLPEMRKVNAAFWEAMRQELRRAGFDDPPIGLQFERKPVPAEIERHTLFTQVCGYPLQTIYRGQALLLGAPVYAADYCAGASHKGVFIVHRDQRLRELAELRGCHFVFNSRHSNSGMNLPRRLLAELARGSSFFASIAETHSQPGNIERVARREADATCVDCVTYAFCCRYRPRLGELTRVLAVTPASPSIPFVTSSSTPADLRARLQDALFSIARKPEWAGVRTGLMLRDVVPIEPDAYGVQLRLAREAAELGYPELK